VVGMRRSSRVTLSPSLLLVTERQILVLAIRWVIPRDKSSCLPSGE
jgi:hypothetical protein